MASLVTVATPILALGALGIAVAAHVGGDAQKDVGPELGELRTQLAQAESERDDLRIQLGKADRQLRGLSSDMAAMRGLVDKRAAAQPLDDSGVAEMGSDAGEAAAAKIGELTPEQVAKIAEVLSTEKGQEALQLAARKERERADAERWDRRTTAMVDRFAEKANLTERQAEQMKDIVGKSSKKIRDVWMTMRASGDLPAEERANLIADNRAKMEDIQTETSDEVKAILSSDQYEIYEDDMSRMRGAWGGGRRGGDRGSR